MRHVISYGAAKLLCSAMLTNTSTLYTCAEKGEPHSDSMSITLACHHATRHAGTHVQRTNLLHRPQARSPLVKIFKHAATLLKMSGWTGQFKMLASASKCYVTYVQTSREEVRCLLKVCCMRLCSLCANLQCRLLSYQADRLLHADRLRLW